MYFHLTGCSKNTRRVQKENNEKCFPITKEQSNLTSKNFRLARAVERTRPDIHQSQLDDSGNDIEGIHFRELRLTLPAFHKILSPNIPTLFISRKRCTGDISTPSNLGRQFYFSFNPESMDTCYRLGARDLIENATPN